MSRSTEQINGSAPAPGVAGAGELSGSLLVLFANVLWSTTGIAGQLLPDVSPPTIAALRLVLGAAALGVTMLIATEPGGRWSDLSGRNWLVLIGAGVCTAAFQLCFFSAVRLTGASLGVLATLGSAPVFAALVDWFVRRERPARAWYFGTALAIVGLGLLLLSGDKISVRLGGLALAVTCGACYAGYSGTTGTLVRRGVPRTSVVRNSLTIGAVLIAPVLIGAEFEPMMNTRGYLIVGWLAVAGTAVPYLAFVAGLRYAPARTAASLGLAQPLCAAAMAVGILHEPVTIPLAVAASLLIGGLVVVSWPARRPPARPLVGSGAPRPIPIAIAPAYLTRPVPVLCIPSQPADRAGFRPAHRAGETRPHRAGGLAVAETVGVRSRRSYRARHRAADLPRAG